MRAWCLTQIIRLPGSCYVGADMAPSCPVVWFCVWLRGARIDLTPPQSENGASARLQPLNEKGGRSRQTRAAVSR
jgi:hypothetical protein